MTKKSLLFDVRCSKTPLLKIPVNIYARFRRVTFKLEVYKETFNLLRLKAALFSGVDGLFANYPNQNYILHKK